MSNVAEIVNLLLISKVYFLEEKERFDEDIILRGCYGFVRFRSRG